MVCTEALPADLLWQKEALLKAARKCLVGCDELAWPAAASAACALAVSLEGPSHCCLRLDMIRSRQPSAPWLVVVLCYMPI